MAPIPVDYYYAGAEKAGAPLGTPVTEPRPARSTVRRLLKWAVLAAVLAQGLLFLHPGAASSVAGALQHVCGHDHASTAAQLCPQEDALEPRADVYSAFGKDLGSDAFRARAVEWHSGAVRIPTESYDKMAPVGEDPRWEAFGPFHDYLEKAFPLVHKHLTLTKVNTYGLVYIWKGSDASLKPLLLMAHQDVVPVDPTTVGQWAHPPYSGHYDGKRIWGRGSSDDKSGLVGIMIAVETLLEKGFAPTRGVVLSFGFDEEASGVYGAQENAKALRAIYGENAFALVIDEGGGFSDQYGSIFAVPAIAEKGYLDVRVDVHAPGGHSSIPPAHTSIGMLARMLVAYEANPYKATFQRGTPVYRSAQCLAAHARDIPHSLKRAIRKAHKSDRALQKAEALLFADAGFRALAGTTQAIDLVSGGVKTNALPEQAFAVVNHRIDTASSVAAVKAHDTRLLRAFGKEFNLSVTAFGTRLTDADVPAYGSLELSDAWGTALEPAPVTDTEGASYKLLSGTIKAVYAAHRGGEPKEPIHVAPGIMSGNTDTRYYWQLSEHIVRYNHMNAVGSTALGGVHTVNESISVDAFLEMVRFFNTLILNVDEADL